MNTVQKASLFSLASGLILGVIVFNVEARQGKLFGTRQQCVDSSAFCSLPVPCFFAGQACGHCDLTMKHITCGGFSTDDCTVCLNAGPCGNQTISFCVEVFDGNGNPFLECQDFSTLETTCLRNICGSPPSK